MTITESPNRRMPFPAYAFGFAAMHDAMRRDARRLVAALDADSSPSDTVTSDVRALARWFDRFKAVIEHHHHCEDDIVWPSLESIMSDRDCGAEGTALLLARQALLDDHQDLDAAMTAVRTSLHEAWTTIDRLDAARRFAVLLDEHLAREEAALFPFLTAHVSEEEFEVIEQAVVEATSLGAMTFTVPWIVDEAPADLCAKVRDDLPTPIRLANRWVLQPRYRRLVAAATGVRVPRAHG